MVDAAGATWTFLKGAFTEGVTLVVERVERSGTGGGSAPRALAPSRLAKMDGLPPSGAANYVYGIGGVYRILVSWAPNVEADLAGYRVYYRSGSAGPPYNGTASVEGNPSPVEAGSTNLLLRGLTVGTRYFVAVAALDTSGNESATSPAVEVATTAGHPLAPASVGLQVGADGTNVLMWARSEDDGYNDRDVVRYEVWRAELPGGDWVRVGELPPGSEVYLETCPAVPAGKFLR